MKRDEALADFSRDHLPALRQAKYLREAGTEEGEQTPREAAEGFLAFWEDHAALHFIEEEVVILPILSRLGSVTDDENIARMLDDHAWLRDRVTDLRTALEGGEDLEGLVRVVGDRLKQHAEMEEQEIFEDLQERLTDDQLKDLHARSIDFRREHRPDDIGPREA